MKVKKLLFVLSAGLFLIGCNPNSSQDSKDITSDVEPTQSYTISFQTDSDEIIDDKIVEEGSIVTLASLPTLEDRDEVECRFACWTLDGNDILQDFVMPSSNITLIARWRILQTWTIKYVTNIEGYSLNDTVIDEDEGLASFILPKLGADFVTLEYWCYDEGLTQRVGDTLDESRFVDGELTLYAKTKTSDISRSDNWEVDENGVYTGKSITQISSVSTTKGKLVSVDIELPAFNKATPFSTADIYFGGAAQLFSGESFTSGYRFCMHGAAATNNDDITGHAAPRSGSIQVFKHGESAALAQGRRYQAPLLGSEFEAAYDDFVADGNKTLTVNITLTLGEVKAYIDIMGTRYCSFDYQNDGGSFGIGAGTDLGAVNYAKFKNITVNNVPETTVTLDVGKATIDTTTVKVPYGSSIANLPIPTKAGFDFDGWELEGVKVPSTYVPGTVETITLTPTWVGASTDTFDTWDGSSKVAFTNGTGTEDNPYLIESAANLAYLAAKVNSDAEEDVEFRTAFYKLTTGIDMLNHEWTPIGFAKSVPFKGYFDGDNHSIKNGVMNGLNYRGLFGYLVDADVKNVSFKANLTTGNILNGGIAGAMYMSTVENCIFAGTINAKKAQVGGIVGTMRNLNSNVATKHSVSTIRNCTNKANISLTEAEASNNGIVGGILSLVWDHNAIIDSCVNEGSVTGGTCTGGVVGRTQESCVVTIVNCMNKGTVSGEDWTGGVICFFRRNASSTMTQCYNYGNVSAANSKAGGVLALNRNTVRECYCASNVKVQNILVDSSKLWNNSMMVIVGGAIAYQNDINNGGDIADCGLCEPLA